MTDTILVAASAQDGRARLSIRQNGQNREVFADHVVAATGYRVDVDRLVFLGEQIRSSLKRVAGAPVLSRNFESSIPGLYFIGTASANCFGPMMRFAYGASYTSRRLSRHLARRSPQNLLAATAKSSIEANRELR